MHLSTQVLDKWHRNVYPFLRAEGGSLIVTVDCGSNDGEAVLKAKDAGVDVVVTDHHEVSEPAPAVALVNPKLGESDDLKSLAGVGVAFKLCHALVKAGLEDEWPELATLDLRDYLDLVAVGTVADVVPLTGENRTLVRHGLARLNGEPCLGLRALKEVAGVHSRVSGYHLGFLIGPRINAAGRIETADIALDLLLEKDPRHARELASRLDSLNRERKRIEDEILEAAVTQLGRRPKSVPGGIVVSEEGWHLGTIGIVSSRLTGLYRVPSAVIAMAKDGMGRGSCRSTEAVDILAVLEECGDLLETFGGHRMAAGLSIDRSNIEAFARRFDEACAARLEGTDLRHTQRVDAWITLGEADYTLLNAVDRLRPLGQGNPTPTWGVRGVRPVGPPRVVGKKMAHLKMTVAAGGSQMDAIAFNMGDVRVPDGALDIVFQLQENTYLGRKKLQLNIRDFCASQGPRP